LRSEVLTVRTMHLQFSMMSHNIVQ